MTIQNGIEWAPFCASMKILSRLLYWLCFYQRTKIFLVVFWKLDWSKLTCSRSWTVVTQNYECVPVLEKILLQTGVSLNWSTSIWNALHSFKEILLIGVDDIFISEPVQLKYLDPCFWSCSFVLSLADVDPNLTMEDESMVWTSNGVVIVLEHQNEKIPLRWVDMISGYPALASLRLVRIIVSILTCRW